MRGPSRNGDNGNGSRDVRGRFLPGNPGGRGNPHGRRVNELRAALLEAVGPEDMKAIAGKLIEMARAGNLDAVSELLNRTIGKPVEADLIQRLEDLEELIGVAAGGVS